MKPLYMRLRQIEFKIHPQRERHGVVFALPVIGASFKILSGPEPTECFTTSEVREVWIKGGAEEPTRYIFKTLNSTYELVAVTPPQWTGLAQV